MLKYFRWAPLKINLNENFLTHEYFHTQKFPNLQYNCLMVSSQFSAYQEPLRSLNDSKTTKLRRYPSLMDTFE